ncbi:MAG: reverse transcriptase/maturase family protein [Defluviitaleaceae bacterium]|nr:reverse transcriptase/maturase family protein [Defluviitaleaceae bacterium]
MSIKRSKRIEYAGMNIIEQGMDKESLSRLWDTWDWQTSRDELFEQQRKLAAHAQGRQPREKIAELQNQITNSLGNKMLAVAKACQTTAQPGVDGIAWRLSWQRMKAALGLNRERKGEYCAKPSRFFVITPKRGKERNIKISTMYDRAMQILYSLAFDSIAEVFAVKKSFGYRKCRSSIDAHYHVLKMLEGEEPPEHIVKADIQAHYESVSHKWLLKNVPMNKSVLGEFLKGGYVFDGEIFPSEDVGLDIGGSISPILANFALDGLQDAVFNGLYRRTGVIDYKYGNLVRFADDIIITAKDKDQAREILEIISRFLRIRGMKLSPTKTKIHSLSGGFEFLSRSYRQTDGVIFSSPSESAVAKFEMDLLELISGYKGSQQNMIKEINQKLIGWASVHKYADAHDAFRRIDAALTALLLDFHVSKSRNRNKTIETKRQDIISKYFVRDSDGQHVYCIPDKKHVRINRLATIPMVHHTPAAISRNPYLDPEYFRELKQSREIQSVTGDYKAIWKRQDGRCYYCGSPMLPDQDKEIIIQDPTNPKTLRNMAYIHSKCANATVDIYKTTRYFADSSAVRSLLDNMGISKTHADRGNKFSPLKNYLWMQTKADITLNFKQLEDILGFEIPPSTIRMWNQRISKNITAVCSGAGYEIKRVDRKKQTIVLKRVGEAAATVKFPDVFFKGKLPLDAVTELEAFLQYLRRKYGF